MAKLRPSLHSAPSLRKAPAPSATGRRRWLVVAGGVMAGLLVLAWFDGGEEPLHPIAEAVALPEQEQ